MSARLGMNPLPIVSWKGKIFYQLTSKLQKNKNTGTSETRRSLFLSPPVKLYRREIATAEPHVATCNSRVSVRIDELNMPNGYSVSEEMVNGGVVNTLDINTTEDKYANGDCTDPNVCLEVNARRRVRSSGMTQRKFVVSRNNENAYFTNSRQYLVSRNKTFAQNQYSHVRLGEPSLISGSFQQRSNAYSPNGLSHCRMASIISGVNDTFYYLWTTFQYSNLFRVQTDPDTPSVECFKVVIPAGFYSIEQLNEVFHNVMTNNKHYYIERHTLKRVFLLNIVFNTIENKIELQSYSNVIVSDPVLYSVPENGTAVGTPNKFPVFFFPPNSGLGALLGFSSTQNSFYPDIPTLTTNVGESSTGFLSTSAPGIFPLYATMNYKPSNSRFATQGAVSASARALRLNYDTITTSGNTFREPFGQEVVNALAYGVPGVGYTLKSKTGYPNTRTPYICKHSGELLCR